MYSVYPNAHSPHTLTTCTNFSLTASLLSRPPPPPLPTLNLFICKKKTPAECVLLVRGTGIRNSSHSVNQKDMSSHLPHCPHTPPSMPASPISQDWTTSRPSWWQMDQNKDSDSSTSKQTQMRETCPRVAASLCLKQLVPTFQSRLFKEHQH